MKYFSKKLPRHSDRISKYRGKYALGSQAVAIIQYLYSTDLSSTVGSSKGST